MNFVYFKKNEFWEFFFFFFIKKLLEILTLQFYDTKLRHVINRRLDNYIWGVQQIYKAPVTIEKIQI